MENILTYTCYEVVITTPHDRNGNSKVMAATLPCKRRVYRQEAKLRIREQVMVMLEDGYIPVVLACRWSTAMVQASDASG